MPTKTTSRSRSRGRSATTKSPKSPKAMKTPVSYRMDYSEGDNVMAKWPGTAFYFHAVITYVRESDNEYDVQYEDGTIFTVKANTVTKRVFPQKRRKVSRSRSRSRGRSPARRTSVSPVPASPVTQRRRRPTAVSAVDAVTPVRQSTRLSSAAKRESSIEKKLQTTTPHKREAVNKGVSNGCVSSMSFEWVIVLILMAFGPFVLVSLHKLCKKSGCQLALPFDKLPKTLHGYWDPQSFLVVIAFFMSLRFLSFLPVGATVRTIAGKDVRMNGFISILLYMAAVPLFVYKKVNLGFVYDKLFYIMTSSLLLAFILSVVIRLIASFLPTGSNINPKGDTNNLIVDFFHGREICPQFAKTDFKLLAFRFSMIGLAMLNVTMVVNAIMKRNGLANPVVVMASAFQVLYALDAMFFEEYYYYSYDAMNSGLGFSLLSTYHAFPFLPTLITKYLIDRTDTLDMPWYCLVSVGVINAIGYVIFRASETQRCEFTKNPDNPSFKHLETLPTTLGKKLLVSGWWGLVRHPNYLGEILIQWSWVLPAVSKAGCVDLLVYYLPVITTLMLIVRCQQQNAKNRRRYGLAWDSYCSRVSSNLIPRIY